MFYILCYPWHSIICWNICIYSKSYFLHVLGLIILPVVVALSSAWSVPFLACMRRWIMSGRTMPLSSRIDMVLCTSDRKKFTTELERNLMWSNCVHETENKYCKWHNILNANSCLCHTYLSRISELAWCSLRKYALAQNMTFPFFCCLGFHTSPLLYHSSPSNKSVFLHLFVCLVCVESYILTVGLEIVTAIRRKSFEVESCEWCHIVC
jgi:hypothetical protein